MGICIIFNGNWYQEEIGEQKSFTLEHREGLQHRTYKCSVTSRPVQIQIKWGKPYREVRLNC